MLLMTFGRETLANPAIETPVPQARSLSVRGAGVLIEEVHHSDQAGRLGIPRQPSVARSSYCGIGTRDAGRP